MTKNHRRLSYCLFASAVALCIGCNRIAEWSLPRHNMKSELNTFGAATRMIIRDDHDQLKKDTTDRQDIDIVVALFKKYPAGWMEFSGAGGDYDILLYQGSTATWRLGLTVGGIKSGEDTLIIWPRFRRVPVDEVTTVVRKLGLQWPTRARLP